MGIFDRVKEWRTARTEAALEREVDRGIAEQMKAHEAEPDRHKPSAETVRAERMADRRGDPTDPMHVRPREAAANVNGERDAAALRGGEAVAVARATPAENRPAPTRRSVVRDVDAANASAQAASRMARERVQSIAREHGASR